MAGQDAQRERTEFRVTRYYTLDLDPGENGRALGSTNLALFSAKNGGIEPALSQS